MKRRNITKGSQERAVLTPSKEKVQSDNHTNIPPKRNRNDDKEYDNAMSKPKKSNSSLSQTRSSPRDSWDPNMMLLLIPLFIFVGLPLTAFGWYSMKNQIHVEQEMGSALLLTIIVGAIIALVSQLSNNGFLRILRLWKTKPPNQEEPKNIISKSQWLQTSDDEATKQSFQQPKEEEVWIQPKIRLLFSEDKDNAVPLILNEDQRQCIAEQVLPRSLADHYWKRLYSLSRDGDTFDWCLKALLDEQRTLFVIHTSQNQILGGYANVAWKTTGGGLVKTTEGGPGACVFCFSEDDTKMPKKQHLKVYKWTGTNRYTQLIDVERQRLAMGAGSFLHVPKNDSTTSSSGQYAWSVERNFTVGTTGRSPTFDNDPLCEPERFEIVELEIFGFSVC